MEIKKLYGELNPYSTQKLPDSSRVQQNQQAQAAQTSQTAQQAGDKVALSPEARLMATSMSVATTASDVRTDKVRDLKEQVQAGTYKPDIRKAAANLIRDEVSLTK